MDTKTKSVLEAALALSEPDRAVIAETLLATLSEASEEDGALAAQIEERLADLDTGTVVPIPWEEAMRLIREEPETDGPTRH